MEERTCPSGHTLTVDKFHSVVALKVKEIDDAIVFDCPAGIKHRKLYA